jgi:hypothetical protein
MTCVHVRLFIVVRLLTERAELKHYLVAPSVVDNLILLEELQYLLGFHLVVLRSVELMIGGAAVELVLIGVGFHI